MKRIVSLVVGGALAMAAGMAVQAAPARIDRATAAFQGAGITAEQRAMLAEKLALVDRIMRASGASQPGHAGDRRPAALDAGEPVPAAARQAARDGGAVRLRRRRERDRRAKADVAREGIAKLGQASTELVYYPITPCRFIDTRVVGGRIVLSRTYDLDADRRRLRRFGGVQPQGGRGQRLEQHRRDLDERRDRRPDRSSPDSSVLDRSAPPTRPRWSTGTRPGRRCRHPTRVSSRPTSRSRSTRSSSSVRRRTWSWTSSGLFAAPTSTPLNCVTGTLTQTAVNTTTRDYNLQASGCPTGYGMVSNSCNVIGDVAGVRQAGGGVQTANDARCIGRYEGESSATIINVPWCCRIPGR